MGKLTRWLLLDCQWDYSDVCICVCAVGGWCHIYNYGFMFYLWAEFQKDHSWVLRFFLFFRIGIWFGEGYDMEVSESTLSTNEERWWYLWKCVFVRMCVVHSTGSSGVYSHSSFTWYRTVFCLYTVVWMLILWLTATVMQSPSLPLSAHLHISLSMLSKQLDCFNFTQKRENFSDLNLILDHLFIHLFILGILPLVTHKTWIYGNYDVRRESLAA